MNDIPSPCMVLKQQLDELAIQLESLRSQVDIASAGQRPLIIKQIVDRENQADQLQESLDICIISTMLTNPATAHL